MTPPPSLFRRSLPLLAVFAAFSALTALLHPDVVRHPGTAVLGGDSAGGYVVWQLWQLARAWREGGPLFHSALVFHPAGADTFMASPLLESAGILLQYAMSPYAAFNLLLLAAYPLAGTAAFFLLRRLTGNAPAAFFGAFAYAFSAYMLNQHRHGHLNETAVFTLPLFVSAVIAFWNRPQPLTWAIVLAAGAGACLSDPYIAFYGGGFLAAGTLVFDGLAQRGLWLRGLAGRMTPGRLGAAASVPALAIAAYWPLLRHAGEWVGDAERLSMYALSHIHPPVWHRAAWWRELFFRGDVRAEEAFGYLGLVPLVLLGLIAVRRLWRNVPGLGYWLWITAFSAVMSWGPALRLAPSLRTAIPLPYALVEALPLLESFRTVSRGWVPGVLACAVWTAMALARLTGGCSRRRQWALSLGACLMWTWELDLPQAREWRFFVRRDMAVHKAMREDPAPGALLELPNGADGEGDLPPAGYLYLLHQPLHGRPMVLGSLNRHRREDLLFSEGTPAVRELTHPWMLVDLGKDPARAAGLKAGARQALADGGIRYVLWHRRLKAFVGQPGEELVKGFLDAWLGPPIAVDGEDHALYRV